MRQISTYLNFNIYATQESIHFKKHLIRSLSRYFNNPHNKLSFDGSSKNRVPKKVSSDTGGIKSLRAGRDSVSSVTCPPCVSFTYRHRSSSGELLGSPHPAFEYDLALAVDRFLKKPSF